MCAGALLLARVAALVWGAPNVRAGADGSWVTLLPQGGPAATPLLLPPDRAEPGLGSGSGYGQAGARDGRAAACADQAAEICNGSGSAAGTGQSVAARDGRSQAEPVSTGAARDAACSGSGRAAGLPVRRSHEPSPAASGCEGSSARSASGDAAANLECLAEPGMGGLPGRLPASTSEAGSWADANAEQPAGGSPEWSMRTGSNVQGWPDSLDAAAGPAPAAGSGGSVSMRPHPTHPDMQARP